MRTPCKDARPIVERCAAVLDCAGTVFYSRTESRQHGPGWFVGLAREGINYRLGSSVASVLRRAIDKTTAHVDAHRCLLARYAGPHADCPPGLRVAAESRAQVRRNLLGLMFRTAQRDLLRVLYAQHFRP